MKKFKSCAISILSNKILLFSIISLLYNLLQGKGSNLAISSIFFLLTFKILSSYNVFLLS